MTSTLHDQLSSLAAPASTRDSGASGGELWARGTRYRRRLRAGTAAVAAGCVLGLAGLVGLTLDRAAPTPAPAPAGAPVALPSRIWTPSPWLPGTKEAGPPGRAVALVSAERRSWTGTDVEPVAVSAATGDYRFLDLDGATGEPAATLSPDGRRVAYWVTGPTTGTPNTGSDEDPEPPAAGVAVLDLVSGEVSRHLFTTEHGIVPEELVWLGPNSLVLSHLQELAGDDGSLMDRSSAHQETTWRWDLSSGEPVRWITAERAGAASWQTGQDGRSLVAAGGRIRLVEAGSLGAAVARTAWMVPRGGWSLSPDRRRIAGVWSSDRFPEDLTVVPVGATGVLDSDWRRPRADQVHHVEGWIDEATVAVTRRSEPALQGNGMAVYAVEAATGDSTLLVRLPDGSYAGIQWATDLMGSPVVDRAAPARPLDPRLVTLAAAALLLAGLAGWVGWRRRVRP